MEGTYVYTKLLYHTLCSFRWEKEQFAPDFSIAPVEGYISPGMEVHTGIVQVLCLSTTYKCLSQVPFDVTFHPHELNPDIRYEALPCKLEKSPSPLTLTLTGMCIEQIPNKEVTRQLRFCVARKSPS